MLDAPKSSRKIQHVNLLNVTYIVKNHSSTDSSHPNTTCSLCTSPTDDNRGAEVYPLHMELPVSLATRAQQITIKEDFKESNS